MVTEWSSSQTKRADAMVGPCEIRIPAPSLLSSDFNQGGACLTCAVLDGVGEGIGIISENAGGAIGCICNVRDDNG